uniref:Myc box-dependent-interacting protein 1 n=1 Tax=Cyclopterus lumpus TaxID=8103 RepID=A0A8C3AYX5_CYCLU
MAELNLGKGLTAGKVASNVQKKLTRAQEKVLQKLGKADETKDVAFEEEVINFNKQYTEGSKLQRDLRAYLEAVKAMHESSKNVQSCLADMYEPEWSGKNEVDSIVEDCDVLWTDYHQKLVSNSLISMDTYLGQFPDIKSRIAKRDRKLVDYDSARHNYATTHKTKKKDGGIKITKPSSLLERATPGWAQGILSAHNVAQSSLSRNQAEDELDRAQKVFEEINIDLQEELPSLWNSRVGFYVSTFQSLAGFEEKFHKEIGRVKQTKQIYTRVKEASNHTLRPGGPPPIPKSPSKLRPAMPPPPKVTPCKEMKTENIISLFDAAATPDINVTSPTEVSEQLLSTNSHSPLTFHSPALVRAFKYSFVWPAPLPTFIAPAEVAEEDTTPAAATLDDEEGQVTEGRKKMEMHLDEKWSMHRFLRRRFEHELQVMHDYAANDTDELEMKTGDVVLVIKFDNPDEQDDGWLMGMTQDDWLQNKENAAKGVFPENFTQRL